MKYSLLIILFCCNANNALANSKAALLLYTEAFPPYSYLKNNEVVGINTDIVSLACTMAAIKCDIKLLPWSRALALTNTNRHSGIYSMSRNQERESNYKWVGPLVASENYFFRLNSRNDIKVSDISSAKNYSIAAPRNDIYEKVLKDRGFKSLLQLSSKYQDVKLFLSGKIDLLIASPLTLPYQLAKQGANLSMVTQLIPLPVPELRGNYLALHPDTAEASVDKLQQALNELYHTGKVEQLIMRYKETLNNLAQ